MKRGRKSTGGRENGSMQILKKSHAGIEARCEMLIEMNKKRDFLTTSGDRNGLLVLSAEYRQIGIVSIANEIQREALAMDVIDGLL